MKLIFISLFIALFSFSVHATTYKLDTAHMQVGFKVTHLVIATVNGHFKKFEGGFDFDQKSGKLKGLNVKVDIDSIDTNESDRDAHLKSADFFGVRAKKGRGALNKKMQYMTFKSSGGKIKVGDNQLKGKLTMGKKTKDVTLNVNYKGAVTDPWGNNKVVFVATTKINRKDFGLTWSKKLDGGGLVVGDHVDIIIEGEANAQKGK